MAPAPHVAIRGEEISLRIAFAKVFFLSIFPPYTVCYLHIYVFSKNLFPYSLRELVLGIEPLRCGPVNPLDTLYVMLGYKNKSET